MKIMNVKVRRIREDSEIPKRASNGAIGYDVYASVILDKMTREVIGSFPVTINPGESVLIGIGVQFAIPWPWQCEVRPRSGLASKYDIELSNSPGTIDPDFRGEAGVLLRNRGKEPFTITEGMRVAQLIFSDVKVPVLEEVEELPKTLRGAGGFGSTGLFEIQEGTKEYHEKIAEQDKYYMNIAVLTSEYSFRKAACVIVKDGKIVSIGKQTEICAVMQALSNLVVSGGASTKGSDMYLNASPCEVCARLIVESGTENVVLLKGIDTSKGAIILKESGVSIRHVII